MIPVVVVFFLLGFVFAIDLSQAKGKKGVKNQSLCNEAMSVSFFCQPWIVERNTFPYILTLLLRRCITMILAS
jgi:hypothetical protein